MRDQQGSPFFTDGMLCRAPRISDALYRNAGYDLISSVNRGRFVRKDLSEYNKKRNLINCRNWFIFAWEKKKESKI